MTLQLARPPLSRPSHPGCPTGPVPRLDGPHSWRCAVRRQPLSMPWLRAIRVQRVRKTGRQSRGNAFDPYAVLLQPGVGEPLPSRSSASASR